MEQINMSNIRLSDLDVKEAAMLRNAEFVTLENFGLVGKGEIRAYVPFPAQSGESGEFYRYVWEWNGDQFEMDIDRSRVMVHNVELLDLRQSQNPVLEQYVPDKKTRGGSDD